MKNETTYVLLYSCIEERSNLCIIAFVYWRTKQPMYYCIRVLKNEITYVLLHSCIEERSNLYIIAFVYWRTKQPIYYCIRVLKNETFIIATDDTSLHTYISTCGYAE